MSSEYLAEVVMPDPPSEGAEEEEEEQLIPESVPPASDGAEEEEEVEEIDYDEDPPPAVPVPTKKEKIPQDEIFTAPKVKSILDPEVPEGFPQKKPKQTRKKRGPATPEQLERLAKGRAKAAETRARKKAEKEKKIALEKEDKQLVEAVRDKERKKLRKKLELDEDIPPTKAPTLHGSTPIIVEKGYSQKDLDDAVQRAVQQSVEKVEVLRKQRKEIKKKTIAKANHEAKVFHEINTAMKPSGWDQCFF